MDKPLVSIIIPCYNAESWIAETIQSALNQTWGTTEIVVIDDGSTDESIQVIKPFLEQGVRLITQKNFGASAARNRGIEQSQGDYIQFLDADDLLDEKKIKIQIKEYLRIKNPEILLSGKWVRFFDSIHEKKFESYPLDETLDAVSWLVRVCDQHLMMHPAAWLVPRSLVEKAGPWNESLSLDDDGEYFSRVVLKAKEIRCCSQAKTFYRSGVPNRLSGRVGEKAWRSAFQSTVLIGDSLIQAEDSKRTRTAISKRLNRLFYDVYPENRKLLDEIEKKIGEIGPVPFEVDGGPGFQFLGRTLGWKFAVRLRKNWYRLK